MNARDRTILVTGGTGFLGSHVNPALQGAGWRVRLAVRAPQPLNGCEQTVVGPIGAATDWREALAGVGAVLHMAARVHRSAAVQETEREQYGEVNTTGTLHLGEAAAAAGVSSFVFVSSLLVHGPSSRVGHPLRETDPLRPATVYAQSKAAAEEGLASLGSRTGLPITILRPPLIYGRGAKGNFALLAKAIRARLPLPFGALRNRRAFVAAENVASFVLNRLSAVVEGTEAFIVADDEQVSTPDFVALMGRVLDRRPVLLPIPPRLLGTALSLAGQGQLRDSLLGSLEADTSKARRTGWRPVVSMEEGLRRALGGAQAPT